MAGIFYRTKSALDGSAILVAAVLPKSAKNAKTGALAQVYIIPDGMEPHKTWSAGAYAAVCGDCPHMAAGSCYVDRTKGSLGVYRAIQRGKSYREVSPAEFGSVLAGSKVRWGADGDPSAIPADEFAVLALGVESCTGYTHQWRKFPHLMAYCMASCDTPAEQAEAKAKGWRTFRTRMDQTEGLAKGEFICPASSEAGYRKTCADCMACDGNLRGAGRADPVIIAHGLDHKISKYKAFRLSLVA